MNQNELPLAYRLAPEMLAAIEDGARHVPEAVRAAFSWVDSLGRLGV